MLRAGQDHFSHYLRRGHEDAPWWVVIIDQMRRVNVGFPIDSFEPLKGCLTGLLRVHVWLEPSFILKRIDQVCFVQSDLTNDCGQSSRLAWEQFGLRVVNSR